MGTGKAVGLPAGSKLFDAESLHKATGHIPAFAARGDGLILTEESLALCEQIGAAEKALGFGYLPARSHPKHADGHDCPACLHLKTMRTRELQRRCIALKARLAEERYPLGGLMHLGLDDLEREYERLIAAYAKREG